MLRVFVSVAVLVVLTAAYVVNPVAGWVSLGSTFAFLTVKRARKTQLSTAEAEAR
jgi:hypothetical protein